MKAPCKNTILWCAAAAFALLLAAWTILFRLAHENKVESVPLATRSAQP